jgi:hypothetical protein
MTSRRTVPAMLASAGIVAVVALGASGCSSDPADPTPVPSRGTDAGDPAPTDTPATEPGTPPDTPSTDLGSIDGPAEVDSTFDPLGDGDG